MSPLKLHNYCYCAAVYSGDRTAAPAVMGIRPQSQIFAAWFGWFLYRTAVGIFSVQHRSLKNILVKCE